MPFQAAISLIFGLLLMSALIRFLCRLVARIDLPWGRAFGLSALMCFVYLGQLLLVSQPDAPPPLPVFIGVVLLTLAASAGLIGWIARDEQHTPIGLVKGGLVAGMLVLFLGLLAALLIFTMPAAPNVSP